MTEGFRGRKERRLREERRRVQERPIRKLLRDNGLGGLAPPGKFQCHENSEAYIHKHTVIFIESGINNFSLVNRKLDSVL